MNRRTFLATAGLASVGLTTGVAATGNDDVYVPRGPITPTTRSINLNAYLTNEELAQRLHQIDARSDRLSLREIARSAGRNDPVWEAQICDGDTNVHLITQIHGDEPVGTRAAVKLLRKLAVGGSTAVETILDNLSLTVVPRANPDGAMYQYDITERSSVSSQTQSGDIDSDGSEEWVGRRYNSQTWAPGDSFKEPWYQYVFEGDAGYDMNRDFNIRPEFDPTAPHEAWWEEEEGSWYTNMPFDGDHLPYEWPGKDEYVLPSVGVRVTPEVRGVTESFVAADPDIAITHHHMGGNLVPGSGTPPKQTILAVMAAFGPSYLDKSAFFPPDHSPIEQAVNPFISPEASTRSIRLNSVVAEKLASRGQSVFDSVTRYGYLPIWGSYLDALCPLTGAAGMLYEIAFQSEQIGNKAIGRYTEATKTGFLATFEELAADPSLSGFSTDSYFDLPLPGEAVDPYETPTGRLH